MARGGFTGLKLGSALSHIAARARIHSKPTELKLENRAKEEYVRAWMERTERELVPFIEQLWGGIRDDPEAPQEIRDFLTSATNPEHQVQAIVNILLTAVGILLNAGSITQPWIQHLLNKYWAAHTDVPLTPAELATAQIKGHITDAEGHAEAKLSGLNDIRYAIMTEATGDPPGPQELGEMVRRGIIDEERFGVGIEQGLIRNDWIGELLALRYGPPSPAEMVDATVQNHVDYNLARAVFAQGGIDPAWFDMAFQTAGEPPGPMELLHLWDRGWINEADVDQGLRESRIKDKWIPALKNLRQTYPNARAIVLMLGKGAIDPVSAALLLQAQGYDAASTEFFIKEGTATKTQAHKDLSEAILVKLYKDQVASRDDVLHALETLGYDGLEATLILDIADVEIQDRLETHAINAVRSQYVRGHIDEPTAQTLLGQLDVPAGKIGVVVGEWNVEKATVRRDLSLTLMEDALKAGLWDEQTFLARVEGLGYSADDATVILALTAPPPAPAATPGA